jgi:hypothetical protein
MADPRYLEAWKRNPQAHTGQKKTATTSAKAKTTAAASTLQVRLDTPGGVTYSPNDLSSHNVIKRLFIPYKVGDDAERKGDQEYNFDKDVEKEEAEIKAGHEQGISAARAYALSIDFDAIAEKRENALREQKQSERIDEEGEDDAETVGSYGIDKMSISGQSKASVSSQMTTATLATISSSKKDGSLPDWYTRTSAHKDVVPFLVPASMTKRPQDHKRPWDAMRWRGHRAFERPSQREIENGIAAFDDVNGVGRAPTLAEAQEMRGGDDSRSIRTAQTSETARQSARMLNVADLFVVDPRRTHTLRMVRRIDPRQVLLICNGVYLEGSQVATLKAAQAAHKAGVDLKDLSNNSKEVQKMIQAALSSARPQGGIGVIYCPNDDPLNQDHDNLRAIDERIDVNCAKRLEAPPEFSESTARRAQLRAVLAAIELANWEEEGFDKIVIGVEQNWIVSGVSNDIWRWKRNGWINATGGMVEDRDLWELIDEAIMTYEKIDCNVRFWQISPNDARLAKNLAEIGALKDLQRPKVVRWRRKKPSVLEASEKKTKNHQGPTLSNKLP